LIIITGMAVSENYNGTGRNFSQAIFGMNYGGKIMKVRAKAIQMDMRVVFVMFLSVLMVMLWGMGNKAYGEPSDTLCTEITNGYCFCSEGSIYACYYDDTPTWADVSNPNIQCTKNEVPSCVATTTTAATTTTTVATTTTTAATTTSTADTTTSTAVTTTSTTTSTSATTTTSAPDDYGSCNGDTSPLCKCLKINGERFAVQCYAFSGKYIIPKPGQCVDTVCNVAPVANAGTLAVDEDTAKNGTLTATDDDEDDLTFSIDTDGKKGTAVITDAATGAYTYTPNADENGEDSFTFKVNDGTSDSNEAATITVTINVVPVANAGTLTLDEDEEPPKVGKLTASDENGDDLLTYSIVSNGKLGTAVITDASAGTYTYTPMENENGEDSFTFKVNDGRVDSKEAEIKVTITSVNDVPVAENGTLGVTQEVPEDGTLTGSDPDGDDVTLTYSIVTNGKLGTVEITDENTGAFTYTPNAGESGQDSFTFKVNDGTVDSEEEDGTVSVTICRKGDIDCDGSIDLKDMIVTLKIAVGFSEEELNITINIKADVNGDGKIGVMEVLFILNLLVLG